MTTTDSIRNLMNAALMRTDVVHLSPDSSLREALDAMTAAHARHAVVEHNGVFIGLVSDRDLRLALPSRLDETEKDRHVVILDGRRVMEVCIRRPYVVFLDGSATRSAQLMVEKKVGCLPVLDRAGRVVGLLTASDFARVFAGLSSASDHFPLRPSPRTPRAA